jgi:hypothetical protein
MPSTPGLGTFSRAHDGWAPEKIEFGHLAADRPVEIKESSKQVFLGFPYFIL